jgi:sugar/nucleoside kinase (ribokinase family)
MGRDLFQHHFASADLVAFVNWTMIPYMSDIWEAMLQEGCPRFTGPRRKIFFDLADPEKRSKKDLLRALDIIRRFQNHFDVILGLNEKESAEVGSALGLEVADSSRDGLMARAEALQKLIPIFNLVVHPVTYAVAATEGKASCVDGPFVEKPLITTGAGDHFNSGYCLGKLLGLDDAMSLLTGVATSGYYVRNARGPSLGDLAHLMQHWPQP